MSVDTYIPVLRNKSNEQEVVQQFGGLSNFSADSEPVEMHPLVEVTSSEDLHDLDVFYDAGEEVLLELPVYQSTRSTKFSKEVQNTLEEHGDQVGFYLTHSETITNPVVSGMADLRVSYGFHSDSHELLSESFPTVVHRVMLRANRLDDTQRASLEELSNELRSTDRVLFDILDTGYNDALKSNLEYLAETFDEQDCAVLNLLNAFRSNQDNLSPKVANQLGLNGFGDFGINVRYPGGGGPTGTVKIRHYHPTQGYVEEFEADDYESAAEELTLWEDWRPDHCEYCRRASTTSSASPSAWKRIRMGHYVTSMLRGEF